MGYAGLSIAALLAKKMNLSIAIPTYNRSKELNSLLKNLSNQINECVQHKNKIEIVISDNCPNDNTKEVVKKFIELNPKLNISYYIHNKNYGLDVNIHRSIESSVGKYVWIIGDDDRLKDHAVLNVFNALNIAKDYSFCFVNYDINVNGKILLNNNIKNETFPIKGEEMFMKTGFSSSFISSNIFNKAAWKKQNFEKYFNTNWYHFFASRDIVIDTDTLIIGQPQITQTGLDIFHSRSEKKNENDKEGLEFYISAHIKFLSFVFSLSNYGYPKHVIKTAKKIGKKDNLRQIIYYKLTRDTYSFDQILLIINKMREFFGLNIIFWFIHVPLLLLPKFIIKGIYEAFLPTYHILKKYYLNFR